MVQRQRSISILLLIAFVVASHAVLPSARSLGLTGTGEERFPCESCACGCYSAKQCWTTCCCYSPSARRAWAEQHDVIPPDYAVLGASDATSSSAPRRTCCSAGTDDDDEPAVPGGGKSPLQCRGKNPHLLAAPTFHINPPPVLLGVSEGADRILAHNPSDPGQPTLDPATPPPQALT